jgi:hypothetical protein
LYEAETARIAAHQSIDLDEVDLAVTELAAKLVRDATAMSAGRQIAARGAAALD